MGLFSFDLEREKDGLQTALPGALGWWNSSAGKISLRYQITCDLKGVTSMNGIMDKGHPGRVRFIDL
jgi:hypothetical protein